MPIIETRGALSSRGYGQFAQGAAAPTAGAFIEDVFSTTLYTGTGAAQSIPNGIRLANGATSAGWIALLGGTTPDVARSIAVDSSGSVYVCGPSDASGNTDFQIAKYNALGVIQWQRRLRGSGTDDAYGIATDSSGNVYVCGYSNNSGTNDFQIAKYNTSGSIQWQRRLGGSGTTLGFSVSVDSSGNVYVCGQSSVSGTTDFQIAKYNTSGAIQWQRRLGGSVNDEASGIAVDSSGNVYVCGLSNNSGNNDFQIAKYNTSGVIQWQRRLGGSGNDRGFAIAVDSSGNAYVCGASDISGTNDFIIAKYNTSGVIQWQRTLGGSGSDVPSSIAVDSVGDVYVCGYSSESGTFDLQIAKYSTSGAIQWQRRLGGTGVEFGYSVAANSSGDVYVCGYSNILGTNDFLLARLPADGSGTGAYNVGGASLTYAISTLTDSASSLTDAATTLTDAATTLTDAASTLTDEVTTLNSFTTPLAEGAGLGGLVWIKQRSASRDHALYDTARGATFQISSNLDGVQATQAQGLTGFLGSGFSIGSYADVNTNSGIFVSWTFAKQPKFFDIVTYTGNGVAGRTIAHSLGSVPGCIMIKRTDAAADWSVYHRTTGATRGLKLNTDGVQQTDTSFWNNTAPTASVFSVGTTPNANGGTYVAYLFAHDAGGFGASGTDSVISCGGYVASGSNINITLGWEPQFVLVKSRTVVSQAWQILDIMRGMAVTGNQFPLRPNLLSAESSVGNAIRPLSTGFQVAAGDTGSQFNYWDSESGSGADYIYIAIRRGPMRTPTNGSSVFTPTVYTGTNVNNRLVNTSIAPDMVWIRQRNDTVLSGMVVGDRLRGQPYLLTGSTAAEVTSTTAFDQQLVGGTEYGNAFAAMNGVWVGTDATAKLNVNTTANNHIAEAFRRAPGFFDVVCYTGTGVARTVNHNLGVVPELMVVRRRDGAASWAVYSAPMGNTQFLSLNDASIPATESGYWNNTTPTSSVFTVGVNSNVNSNASTYVAYLFASCPAVSKVGTYTGTGSTVQVNCGFTSGARFVLIKRTDSTSSWFVWDSARGIIASNDPYLTLNQNNAEVTSTDWVDTLATGFEVSNAGSNLVNVNGGTYLFLAVS